MSAPTGPLPAPTSSVVQSCRDVITAAGAVTLAGDPRDVIADIERVNPALAGPLGTLMDAVMTLDYRTGFLAQ